MAQTTLAPAFLDALDVIKDKGFGFIKLELEAQLNRGYANANCEDCTDGYVLCDECKGDGFIIEAALSDEAEERECTVCGGEGQTDCRYCNGRGSSRDGATVEWCEDFILAHMGQAARKALVYGNFYDDGSVDSEFTFTMPIEQASLCLDVIEAFKQLNYEINGTSTIDIENAGMHLSILPTGEYPCQSGLLNSDFMSNFRKEVTKLLPALYLLATHNSNTRDLEYRMPRVSADDKYSAIYTHGDTCMEFRIFDTCYSEPEALLEKIQVVAATLKYYSSEKANIKYKKFVFPQDTTRPLTDWFQSVDNYDALNQTLRHLKPLNKTIKAIKSERKLKITRLELVNNLHANMSSLAYDYESYKAQVITDYEHARSCYIASCLDMATSTIYDLPYALERLIGSRELIAKKFKNTAWATKFIDTHSDELGMYRPKVDSLRTFAQNRLMGGGVQFDPITAQIQD